MLAECDEHSYYRGTSCPICKKDGKFLMDDREVKKLSGMLPIYASCKKILDDKGYWKQIESYIQDHSEAELSHSICPECAGTLYPALEIYDD